MRKKKKKKSKNHTRQCGWHLWKQPFKSDSSHAEFVLIVVDYEVIVVISRKSSCEDVCKINTTPVSPFDY